MNSSKPKPPLPKLDIWGYLAVAYPLGLAPKAPGTFGSLPGLVLGAGIFYCSQIPAPDSWMTTSLLASTILVFFGVLSWLIIAKTEAKWNTHDDGRIVIDEILGQAIPLSFLGFEPLTLLLSFILFRFFDIVKPGPIGWIDRKLPGAWGTLLDDVLAGVCTALMLMGLPLLNLPS